MVSKIILFTILLNFTCCLSQICTKPGLACRDCWTSVNCTRNVDGSWSEELNLCETGTACINATGICNNTGKFECDSSSLHLFTCHGSGVFPDPFNCKSYHTCVSNGALLQDFKSDCPDGYGFNPYTGRCGIRLEDPSRCPSSVPICTKAGVNGSIDEYPGIYYLCVEGYIGNSLHYLPEIFACPSNQYYNGTLCLDPTPVFVDNNGKCISEGNYHGIDSCKSYRFCSSIGSDPFIRACGSYQKFDPIKRQCVPFVCSDYQL